MADHDDPERQRRLKEFREWVEPGGTVALERQAFLAGCDYEARLLEDLLERMEARPRHELELLREVAAVVEGWTGDPDGMREASFVFAKVAAYVRLSDQEAREDAEETDS